MRLGLFMMPVHPPGRVLAETLAEDEEKAIYADRLGFDELWLGEHFSATTEPIPSPLMFMAGLVPRTKNLTFGTAVICLPNHHPVKVAAEVAQFDHMSRGRFMLGIGIGGLYSDFELFDNGDRKVRERKVMESIGMIERIWAQDPPYELKGEFWNVELKDAIIPELGIGYMPKPYRKGGPPISMSVSSRNSPTARVAAQRGWGIISATMCRARRCRRIGRPTARLAPRPASRRAARIGAWRAMSWWRRARRKRATASSANTGRTAISTLICARCSPASACSAH
jgi:alkanesulfonate monooxygenase SsuD/methylene tetrahydromethanopterin reductase-like flavin-dependent oxidoreductase (luciferase family)